MEQLLMTALLLCLEGEAQCTITETRSHSRVYICDIAPDNAGMDPHIVAGGLRGKQYVVTFAAACTDA